MRVAATGDSLPRACCLSRRWADHRINPLDDDDRAEIMNKYLRDGLGSCLPTAFEHNAGKVSIDPWEPPL